MSGAVFCILIKQCRCIKHFSNLIFFNITLNENHIVEPTVLEGHFVQEPTVVKQPSSPGVLVAQWLERLTQVMEIRPVGRGNAMGVPTPNPKTVKYIQKVVSAPKKSILNF